jgi:hypothetical protein
MLAPVGGGGGYIAPSLEYSKEFQADIATEVFSAK